MPQDPNTTPQEQWDEDAWLEALSGQESGGDYSIKRRDKTGATGRWQVIESNIPKWTEEVMGFAMTPEEFGGDAAAQDVVVRAKVREYQKNRGGNLTELAKDWYGRGKPPAGHPSPDQYAAKVISRYRQVLAKKGQQPAVTGEGGGDDPMAEIDAAIAASQAPSPQTSTQPVPMPTHTGTEGEVSPDGTYKWQNGTWVYGNGLLPSQQQGAVVDPQRLVVDPNNPQQGPPQQTVNMETGLQEAGAGGAPATAPAAGTATYSWNKDNKWVDAQGNEADPNTQFNTDPVTGKPMGRGVVDQRLRDAGVNGYMPPSPTELDGTSSTNQYLAGQLVRPEDHESPLGSQQLYYNSHPEAIKKILDPNEQAARRSEIAAMNWTPEEKAKTLAAIAEAETWAKEQGGFKDRERQGILSGVADPALRASMEAKLASGEAFTPEETKAATAAAAQMQGLAGGDGSQSVAEALSMGSPLNADGTYNEAYDQRALERYSKERDIEEEQKAAKYEQWRAQRQFGIQFSGEGANADLTLDEANARLRDFVFNTKGDIGLAQQMHAEGMRQYQQSGHYELNPDGTQATFIDPKDGVLKGKRNDKAFAGIYIYDKDTGKPIKDEAEWQAYRDKNAQTSPGNPQRTISVFADEDLIRIRNAWKGDAYEAQLQQQLDDPEETIKHPEVQARRAKWLATSKVLRKASGPDSRTGMDAMARVQQRYDTLTPRQKAIYDTGEDPGPDASQMSDRNYASIGVEAGVDLLGRAWDATLGADWYGEGDILPKPTNHMEHMIKDALAIQMDTPISNTFANFTGANYSDEQYRGIKFHKDKNGKLVVDSNPYTQRDGGFKPVTAIRDAFTTLYGLGTPDVDTHITQEAYQQLSTFTSALLDNLMRDYDPRYDKAFNAMSPDQQQAFMEWRAGRHQLASTLGSTANLLGSVALTQTGLGGLEALSVAAKAGRLKTFLQGTSALLARGQGVGRSLVEASVLSAMQEARAMGAPTLDEWAAGGGWNEQATYAENVGNYFKGVGLRIPSNFNQFQGGRYAESVAQRWAEIYGLKGLKAAAAGRIGEAFGEVAPEAIEQIITQKQDWEALRVNALYGILLGRKAGPGRGFVRSSATGITYTVDPNTGIWTVAPESGLGAPGKHDLVLTSAATLGPDVDFDGAMNRLMGVTGQAQSSVAPKATVQGLGLGTKLDETTSREDQAIADAGAAEVSSQLAAGGHQGPNVAPPQSIFNSEEDLRQAGERASQIEEHLSTQGPDELVGAVAEQAEAFTKLADIVETGLLGKEGTSTGALGLDGTADIPAAKTEQEKAKVLTDAVMEAARLPDGSVEPALLATLTQKVAELHKKQLAPKDFVKELRDAVKEEQDRLDATQKEFAAPDKQRERFHKELALATTAANLHTQEKDAAKAATRPLLEQKLVLGQQAARANLATEQAKTAAETAEARYRDAIDNGVTGGALKPIREAMEVAQNDLAYAQQQKKEVDSKFSDATKAVTTAGRRYTKAEIAVAKAEQRRENALTKLEDFHEQQLAEKAKAKKEKEEAAAAPKAPKPAPAPNTPAPAPASPAPAPNTPASPASEAAPKSAAPVPAPAKGRTIRVNDTDIELDEEQSKAYDKAEAQYKAEIAHAENPVMDKADAAKRKKAAGFRFAAQKRVITDQLTAKERQKQQQDAAKINVGKRVTVTNDDGTTLEGVVATNPVYGKVGVTVDGEAQPRSFPYGSVRLATKQGTTLNSVEPVGGTETAGTAKDKAARAAILADPEQVAELAKAAVAAINAVTKDPRVKEDSKGASIGLDGKKATTGYAVAIDPQFEHVIPAGTDEASAIAEYLQRPDIQKELANRTNSVLGMWRNPELDNALTLDVSEIWDSKAKAVQEGIARKQWGIFDIELSLELDADGSFKSGFIPLDADAASERTLNSTEYGGGDLSPTSTSLLDSPEGRRRYLDESGNLAQIADAALTYLDAAGGKPAVVALSGIDLQEGYAVPANLEQGFSANTDEATALIQYLIRPDVVAELAAPGTALAVWRDGSGMRANVVHADASKREAVSFGEVNGHVGLFDIDTGKYEKLEIGALVKSLAPVIEDKYRQLGVAIDGKPLAHVRAQIVKNVMETFGVTPQGAIDILWEEGLFGINVHNVVRMTVANDAEGNPIYNDVEVKRLSDGSLMLAQRSSAINLFESNVVGDPPIKKGILADIEKDLRKIVRDYNRNSTNAEKRKEILAAIDEALKPYVKEHRGAQTAAVAAQRKALAAEEKGKPKEERRQLTKEEVDAIRNQIPPTEVEAVRARLAKELELDQFPEMTLDDLAPQREAMTERARLDALNKLEDIIKALNKQTKKKFQPFDMKGPRATKAQKHKVWAKKAATRFADDMMIDLESFFDDFINHADKFRDIDRNLLTPESAKALINRAFFWYTEGVKVATAHAARAFPELGVKKDGTPKDKFATMAFHTLLGMHSPGTDPASNSVAAVNHYYEWTKLRKEAVARGENPDKILLPMVDEAAFVRVPGKIDGKEFEVDVPGGAFSRAGHNTVIALNALATHQFDGDIKKAFEWLHQEHPIAEIRKAASYSKGTTLDLPDTPTAVGSLIFGAKVGAFVANVHGNLDYLTADLWFTRSWNRGMGTLQVPPRSGSTIGSEPRHEDERRAMRLGTLEVAKRLEEQWKSATKLGKLMREVLGTPKTVSMAEAQSILWYMEQQIWARQGGLPRSQSFEEGTKNHTDNWPEKVKEREETRKAVHAAMLSSYYYETTPERRQVATGQKKQPAGDVRNYSASPDLLSNLGVVESLLTGYEVMKAKPGLPQKPKLVNGKYHIIRTGETSALPENIFDTEEAAEDRLDDLREARGEFNQGPVRYEALLIQKQRITEALIASTGLTVDQIKAQSLVRVHQGALLGIAKMLYQPAPKPAPDYDVQAELQRISLQGGTPTDQALVAMLAMKPEYIPNVAAYLLRQREKLLGGKLTPRDVAKALILTRASIGAGEIDLGTNDANFDAAGLPDSLKGSNDIGNMPASNFQTQTPTKAMIRPEDQMAKFLFTPQGQALLDHLEQVAAGKVELDRSLFAQEQELTDHLKQVAAGEVELDRGLLGKAGPITHVRRAYGRVSTITDMAKESGKTKATKYNMDNLGELTKAINAAGKSGDMEALGKVLLEVDGIGTGKKGFIFQLLGFGGESTIDTVEISTWLFGKKEMPSDPEGKALHRYASSQQAAPIVKKMVKEGFARLAASPGIAAQLTEAEMDPQNFETIFHHWFWDRAKGTETSHKGLYDAMELAQKLLGSQHVAGRVLGYTRVNAMQPSTIGLFQGANPATLLHEDAHGFRRFMNAADMAISTDWVEQVTGVKVENGEWQVAHEEAFARGFEQWLLEGRLPADAPKALKGVFQRLKQLVLDSYKESVDFQNKGTVDDFVGPLTDPMRGVFERMIGYRADPMNATEQAIHNNLVAQNQEAIGRDVVPTTQAQADARDMMLSYCRWDFRRMPIADQRALLQEIFEVQRDRIEPLEADTVLGPVFGSRLREFKPSKMPANGMAALQRRLTKRLREASGRADANARALAAHIPADAVTIVEIDRFAQHAFNAMYPHQRVAKRRSAFLRYAAVYHPEYILNLNRARATLAGLNINDVKWRGREARLRELVANAPTRPMGATMPMRRGSTTLNSQSPSGLHLTHYSTTGGLDMLDPNFQGTGARSSKTERDSLVRRSYFYITGKGKPEPVVIKNPRVKHRYETTVDQDKLYDLSTDKQGIIAEITKNNEGVYNADSALTAIRDAGYIGYLASGSGGSSNIVALFHPQPVSGVDLETGSGTTLNSQTPMNVPANTEAEEALQKVLDYFGTTDNIKEAGMLHPEGMAIALFKTGFGMHTERLAQSGVDNLSLLDFITETGAARISSDGFYLNVESGAPLTRAQAEALEDQAYSHREVRVDFHKKVEGEWDSFEHVVVEQDDAGKFLGKLRRAEREAFGHRGGYRVLYSANPPATNPDDIIAAAEELAAEFERVERASMVSIIGDIRKSMMLTSPKTHLRNLVGNLGFQAAEEFSRFPAVMFDVLASLRYGQRSITANQLDTMKAVIHTFTTRNGETIADKGGITRAFEEIMGVSTTNTQTTDNHHGWNRDNRAVQILEKINNVTFKFLAAEDALFNTFALRRALLDMARVAVKNKEVATQADYMNSLTDDQIDLAFADALFATFNNSNKVSTFISGLKRMMSEDPDLLSQSGRLILDMIVPFDRTPMNILARIVDYTPVGLAIGSGGRKETEYLIGRRREEEGGEPNSGGIPIRSSLTGKISQAEAIRAKKELMTAFDKHDLQMLQKEMAKQTGRGVIGTVIMIGAALGAKGILRGFYGDDEEEWIESWGDSYRIKAFGQSDDTLRNDTDNSQRNSINIGGEWYSIDTLAPIGPLLILGATIRESMDRGDTYTETGTTFLVEAARQVMSMPVVRGFTDLGKAMEDGEDKGPRFLGRMVTSFIPSIIRDIADFKDDKEREAKGVVANIKMAIPGALGRESLPVKRDFLGRELPQKGGLEAIFDLFRSRASRSSGLDANSVGKTADKDPVFRELDKWDITLTKPAKEEGESEEDYNIRVTVVGNAAYRALQAEVQADRYKAMAGLRDAKGQNKQAEQLKDVIETAKSRASSHLTRILKERGKVKPPEAVEYPRQEARAKEAAEAAQRKAEAAAKKASQFPSMDFDLSTKPKKPKLPRPKTLEGLDTPATPQGPGTPIDFGKQEYEDGEQ